MRACCRAVSGSIVVLVVALLPQSSRGAEVGFAQRSDSIVVQVDGRPVAHYVFRDRRIPRPYFAHVCAPEGTQVTRNHPPVPGKDSTDHDTMHPGIWLAFGDLSGSDFWRNKARILHHRFVEAPEGESDRGSFAVQNRYLGEDDGAVLCNETCRFTFLVRPAGYLLIWDSTFGPEKEAFYFGDQEELGLGVRLATPIAVANQRGGRIVDSRGRRNEPEVWGKQAEWCDYSGTIDGRRVGIALMPDPANFRPCWWHARDYGFMAGNPFGRNAFTGEAPSRVVVEPGESLRLRYGVLIHSDPADREPDLGKAYGDFLQLLGA